MPVLKYLGGGALATAIGAAIWANLASLGVEKASIDYISKCQLRGLDSKSTFPEAHQLSSIKDQLAAHNFALYAVVHQVLKGEIEGFQPYFKGPIFYDAQRCFYGPRERWMGLTMGLFRPGVWKNIMRANKGDLTGNLVGEGRLLGGVFVIAPGDGGILLEHRESEWGDHVDVSQVLQVVSSYTKTK